MSDLPIICKLEAIPEEQRVQHQTASQILFAQVQAITELPDGYQFAFPVELLVPVTEFISLERLCCPFWDFGLRVPPGSEQVFLTLGGGADVKQIFYEGIAVDLAASDPTWQAFVNKLPHPYTHEPLEPDHSHRPDLPHRHSRSAES